MNELPLIDIMELVCTTLNELICVSEKQQVLLGAGKLDELPTTFEDRQVLFDKLTLYHERFIELGKSIPTGLEQEIEIHQQQINTLKEQFLSYDQRVFLLLTHHLEKLEFTLLQRLRAREAIKDYQEAERATNLIARLFEGNTRHMDVKK